MWVVVDFTPPNQRVSVIKQQSLWLQQLDTQYGDILVEVIRKDSEGLSLLVVFFRLHFVRRIFYETERDGTMRVVGEHKSIRYFTPPGPF